MPRRSISRIDTPAPPAPGGIGRGHTAVEVVLPTALESSDPFVLLMDDRFDFGARRRIGGAHPHAGLETVTLILDGTLHDRDVGDLAPGDAIWMSAGRGIIHDEDVEAVSYTHLDVYKRQTSHRSTPPTPTGTPTCYRPTSST